MPTLAADMNNSNKATRHTDIQQPDRQLLQRRRMDALAGDRALGQNIRRKDAERPHQRPSRKGCVSYGAREIFRRFSTGMTFMTFMTLFP
jgi:hypothetical protein